MSLERLWAGWRTTYIDGVATQAPPDADHECLFERLAREPDDVLARAGPQRARVRGDERVPLRVRAPDGRARCGTSRRLAGLSRVEAAALMELVQDANVAVLGAYSPDGINVGANIGRAAGAGRARSPPRARAPTLVGDTNFMTTVAEARVLPEPLTKSYEKLAAAWPR